MDNFATELLAEVKKSAKRWFIAFIIVTALWFATIAGFVWYISLPSESYNISQESEDNGNNQIVGGDYIGDEADS